MDEIVILEDEKEVQILDLPHKDEVDTEMVLELESLTSNPKAFPFLT